MKKFSSFILITAFVAASGQTVSDYEYIYVPKQFEKKVDGYNLNKNLVKALSGKKYKVIQDTAEFWPSELKNNNCQVLKANLLDDSSFLKNKLKVQFKDCNDKVILEAKGSSAEKDYDLGFNEALKQSLQLIPVSNPKTQIAVTQKEEQSASEATKNIDNKSVEVSTKAEAYSNGTSSYQRINIGADQFILANTNSSVPFATFKETTKPGVFRVQLDNGIATIGYIENGNIIIEIPQGKDLYKKEIFQKK